jgi:hypothetical protein
MQVFRENHMLEKNICSVIHPTNDSTLHSKHTLKRTHHYHQQKTKPICRPKEPFSTLRLLRKAKRIAYLGVGEVQDINSCHWCIFESNIATYTAEVNASMKQATHNKELILNY